MKTININTRNLILCALLGLHLGGATAQVCKASLQNTSNFSNRWISIDGFGFVESSSSALCSDNGTYCQVLPGGVAVIDYYYGTEGTSGGLISIGDSMQSINFNFKTNTPWQCPTISDSAPNIVKVNDPENGDLNIKCQAIFFQDGC